MYKSDIALALIYSEIHQERQKDEKAVNYCAEK
jgi:hypothetical protein